MEFPLDPAQRCISPSSAVDSPTKEASESDAKGAQAGKRAPKRK